MQGPARPKYTERRHAWLRLVADRPGIHRTGQGACAFSCMQLGWTEWTDPQECKGEQLTQVGREVLAFWDNAMANARRLTKYSALPPVQAHKPGRTPKAPPNADTQLLDTLEANCWDLRCIAEPTGAGDADTAWEVVGHFMAPPAERVLGYGRTARQAIQAAIVTGRKANAATELPAPTPQELPKQPVGPCPLKLYDPNARTLNFGGPRASLGGFHQVAPSLPAYVTCEACDGKGSTGYGHACRICLASGKVKRTVPA